MEIIIGIIVLLLLGLGAGGLTLSSKIGGVYRQVYGSKSLKQVIHEGNWEEENIPRSVSNATPICLPRVQKDFPEFNWSEMQMKAKNVLKSMLLAINNHDTGLLTKETNPELKQQVQLAINDDENGGVRTYYDDITVHQVEMWKYTKKNGQCVIEMQASAGYRMWKVKDNEVVYGSKEKMRQTKYMMHLIYVQDASKLSGINTGMAGFNCPNCGAPITTLGAKHCIYCGAAMVYEYNIKIWNFGAIDTIKG